MEPSLAKEVENFVQCWDNSINIKEEQKTSLLNLKAKWQENIKENNNQVLQAMGCITTAMRSLKLTSDELEKIFKDKVLADESESSGQSVSTAESQSTCPGAESESAWASQYPKAPSVGVAMEMGPLKDQFNEKVKEVEKLIAELLGVEDKLVCRNEKIDKLMETISTVRQALDEACDFLKKSKGQVDTAT